jgi:hypothetical protein
MRPANVVGRPISKSFLREHTHMDADTRKKKMDLPPTGSRNLDPITDEPGARPIEAGIGAAFAGAAGGLAFGAVAGPAAAALGAAVGAVAGGYAGKGLGEFIDPTTEDDWLRENFRSRPYVEAGESFESYIPAYRYGAEAEAKYGDAGIDLMDEQLQRDWEASQESDMPWEKAGGAIRDAYDCTVRIRKDRMIAELPESAYDD